MNVEDIVTDLCDSSKRVLLLDVEIPSMLATGKSRGLELECERTRGHNGPHLAHLPPSAYFCDQGGKVYQWPNSESVR